MLSWFSAPRNPAPGSQEPMDNTVVEPPETPAPVFAARALKHAIFGTPAPPETVKPARFDTRSGNAFAPRTMADKLAPKADPGDQDGLRRGGILSTPGTLKGRKTVSFGAQVVDNEGKKSNIGTRSGLPNDCPGKFPSPWTPRVDGSSDVNPHSSSKLTAKLYEARDSSRTETAIDGVPKTKPRAKDDGDITLDVMEPRSESGRYWKEQFLSYSQNSEKEVKKLVKKQQIAKEYAKKKDAEALELSEKLEVERKRHKQRERELADKNRDYKERLRQAMAETLKSSTEMATLKQRLAVLEAKVGRDVPLDPSLPKTQLEIEFDQLVLDPQQASHVTLDATPVNSRNRSEKAKTGPSPLESQAPKSKDALHAPQPDSASAQHTALGVSARRPRRPVVSTKQDRLGAAESQAKHASTSPVEDPWMANGETIVDMKPSRTASPAKKVTRNAASEEISQNGARSNRAKGDRTLQPLANAPGSAMSANSENLSPEEARKKLALERIMQKRRERNKDKENSRANVLSMR